MEGDRVARSLDGHTYGTRPDVVLPVALQDVPTRSGGCAGAEVVPEPVRGSSVSFRVCRTHVNLGGVGHLFTSYRLRWSPVQLTPTRTLLLALSERRRVRSNLRRSEHESRPGTGLSPCLYDTPQRCLRASDGSLLCRLLGVPRVRHRAQRRHNTSLFP